MSKYELTDSLMKENHARELDRHEKLFEGGDITKEEYNSKRVTLGLWAETSKRTRVTSK